MKEVSKKEKGGYDYDSVNDTVFFYVENKKYKESKAVDNFVIDIDEKNTIRGMEILNASKVLNVKKEMLRSVNEISASVKITPEIINIKIIMNINIRNSQKQNILNIEKINSNLLQPMQSQISIT